MSRRIAVVCGGRGGESDVSRTSGAQVHAALSAGGHDCTLVEAADDLWDQLRGGGYDAAFLALHGRHGEDGTVQGLCELLGLPYTGSDVLASALCYDKAMAKRVLAGAGLPTPEWRLLDSELGGTEALAAMEAAVADLGLPIVVKPVRGGSTIGLTVVRDARDLPVAHADAAAEDQVLCETFVAGCEITVGIVGHNVPRALPTLEIVSHRPLYDYAAKYTPGQSEHIIPARLPEAQREAAQATALAAHLALGCRDMSRVDLIVDAAGTPWVLEVNSIPGLTELSLLPDAARAAGISFAGLCEQLVESACLRAAGRPPS
ncbi:MAG: D-alanine--D-alanine ligase [Candidatus Dormibacteria bacterium]